MRQRRADDAGLVVIQRRHAVEQVGVKAAPAFSAATPSS
jgi:hypothetical protein